MNKIPGAIKKLRVFFYLLQPSKWHCRFGTWWMVQIIFDGWISFGIHIDFKHRRNVWNETYGPYIDIHLAKMILSIGWHPYLSTDLERVMSASRGGPAIDGTGTVYK